MAYRFYISLLQIAFVASCARSQITPAETRTQWLTDHFEGSARLTYNGAVFYGAFVQDNYHSSRVPDLGLQHFYRVTFTPEKPVSFPANHELSRASAQATAAGHAIFVWGPYTLDCTPADAVIREYFKSHASPLSPLPSQKMLDARMAGDTLVLTLWEK